MIQEYIPHACTFFNELTRQELQTGDTCTTFGFSSSSEGMAHRAGIKIGEKSQISPYFLWYYRNLNKVSIEGIVDTANRVGYVPDEMYPYNANNLNAPSLEALLYGEAHKGPFATSRIAGQLQVMRTICKGSTIISQRYGVTMEHVECIIGYDKTKGFLVQGSGTVTDYWPWSELPLFTQLHKYTKSPFGFIPFADYVPAALPEYKAGVLSIPHAMMYSGWMSPMRTFKDVELNIANVGTVKKDWEMNNEEPMWKSETNEWLIPELLIGDTIYNGVVMKGATYNSYSGQEIT